CFTGHFAAGAAAAAFATGSTSTTFAARVGGASLARRAAGGSLGAVVVVVTAAGKHASRKNYAQTSRPQVPRKSRHGRDASAFAVACQLIFSPHENTAPHSETSGTELLEFPGDLRATQNRQPTNVCVTSAQNAGRTSSGVMVRAFSGTWVAERARRGERTDHR